MFPKEISLEDAVDPEWLRIGWKHRGLEIPTEPYNPFQYDMLSLGIALQQHVRVSNTYAPSAMLIRILTTTSISKILSQSLGLSLTR
jgi:hypothetical protein